MVNREFQDKAPQFQSKRKQTELKTRIIDSDIDIVWRLASCFGGVRAGEDMGALTPSISSAIRFQFLEGCNLEAKSRLFPRLSRSSPYGVALLAGIMFDGRRWRL